jgi:hypothetical protein
VAVGRVSLLPSAAPASTGDEDAQGKTPRRRGVFPNARYGVVVDSV